jgi:tetratricopeptide (TPR) repeat protein
MPSAIRLYREILKSYPDAAQIRSNLGAALVRDGKFDEAIVEYQKALQKLPEDPRVRMNLALAYFKLGHLPDAERELQTVHNMAPAELRPALLLADCEFQMGKPQKAVDLLSPYEQQYPNDKALIYMLGVVLLKANHPAEAQVLLDRLLRDGQSAETEFLLGQGEYAMKNNIVAAEHLARAVQLNPKLPGLHVLYGRILHDVQKPDQAAAQFREELKLNPYDFEANLELAAVLKQENRFDEAQALLDVAFRVRPNDPGAFFQRAVIYFLTGKAEQSRQILERLVREYPSFTEAHIELAAVYFRLKRVEDGKREQKISQQLQDEDQKKLQEGLNKRDDSAKDKGGEGKQP